MIKNTAIVLAGGSGSRMNSDIPKQYIEVNGKPLLAYSLIIMDKSPVIDEIILVARENDIEFCQKEIVAKFNINKVTHVVKGGNERYWSVLEGLKVASGEYVWIHDGARPCLSEELLDRLNSDLDEYKATIAAVSSKDTVKIIEDGLVKEVFTKIKEENGKLDGIVHSIAHANTEDLHNDFVYTSKEGYSHAVDVSAYSFVLAARMAKELDMLNENASIITLTYHGSTKVIEGYNVMGVAKAALESSVRYLAENLGKEGFRVNAISAGPIKTLSAKGIKDFSTSLTVVEEKSPLHRNVTTIQVGNVSTFLLSNMSDAITGQVIYADSGYSIMGV